MRQPLGKRVRGKVEQLAGSVEAGVGHLLHREGLERSGEALKEAGRARGAPSDDSAVATSADVTPATPKKKGMPAKAKPTAARPKAHAKGKAPEAAEAKATEATEIPTLRAAASNRRARRHPSRTGDSTPPWPTAPDHGR